MGGGDQGYTGGGGGGGTKVTLGDQWDGGVHFLDRGHRGPYKLCNHNLYIGMLIFPHIDNPQSTGYN